MKRFIKIFLLLMEVGILNGCMMNKLHPEKTILNLHIPSRGKAVRIDILKGEEASALMKAGPFRFNILPQIVIWAEDETGHLLQTLYITGADYKKMRHAGKSKEGKQFYRECFPLWAFRLEAAGGTLPSKDNPYPDTVTSATPHGDFSLLTGWETDLNPTRLFLEINQSADENAFFSEEKNDWAGQPALVYSCEIPVSGHTVTMELAGHSGLMGSKPALYPDLTGFDTALYQIREIKVSFP